ncbi:Brisc And Brca1-A Complex Member 1 [Manis pentadactyla]|nr:Brisc And Brca1-A Complex Member 1 [Manis pentadactyla]
MSRVTGGIQTADGDGDSCVLDLLPLGQEALGSRMDLSGTVQMTLVMCTAHDVRKRWQPYGSLKHRQDDSGDVLLMIPVMGMGIHVSVSCCLEVKLTTTRVTGGIQTADGDGDSCVLDILPLGQEDACSRAPRSLRHRQVDSGDVLLMISGRRLQPYGSLRHPQDDSGDLLLRCVIIKTVFWAHGAYDRKALGRMDPSKHRQDDSGDVLLMILLMRMEIHVYDLLPLGQEGRWQPHGSLRHRPDDSGDVLLMMSGRRWQPYGSLKHRQDDSGDVLLMIVKSATRVTGGIQTADGDGDSCVLDLLPLGQEDACSHMNLSGMGQVDSGDVLAHDVRKALAAVWISQASSDDSGDVLLMMSRRALQPYESLRHRQVDSGDVLLMIFPGKDRADEEFLREGRMQVGGSGLLQILCGKTLSPVIEMCYGKKLGDTFQSVLEPGKVHI